MRVSTGLSNTRLLPELVEDQRYMTKILGIDPGFGRLGFGCVTSERGKLCAIDHGIISTSAELDFADRLLELERDLDTVIRELQPNLIAIEKLYFSKNVKTAMDVAESRGVVRLVAARRGIRAVEFTPTQIKKALSGDGKADKKAVQFMVAQLLSLKSAPKVDDAADALAVAICASVFPS